MSVCADLARSMGVNSGRATLSLGCCGARAYLDAISDDIALWVLPGNKVGPYAERIAILSKSNTLLTQFHQLRRKDVEDGRNPTYNESLARLHG
ncbi:MAG: hypothetical protein HY650_03385 [Acidobacteria bacterium]|nr:hypothetical protein [Acidobacteriota bacterium]